MSLFRDALLACLPVVQVDTDDPWHVMIIAKHHLQPGGEVVAETTVSDNGQFKDDCDVLLIQCRGEMVDGRVLREMVKASSRTRTIVVVNAGSRVPEAYYAGPVVPPYDVVHDLVVDAGADDASDLMPSLSGLSLKEADEVLCLAAQKYKELTPRAILATRRECIPPTAGLDMIDPKPDPAYACPDWLGALIINDGYFLTTHLDASLRPRGLLLFGPPGTGKTSAAKMLAHEWQVPLLRLDMGGVKQKYMGESEANLRAALARAEAEAPCVLLIDEVEKALHKGGSDDTVTPGLLAYLLWWLAEHRSPVYVVMTTNDADALPQELYRPGRIDRVEATGRLVWDAAVDLAAEVIKPYLPEFGEPSDDDVARAYAVDALNHPSAQWHHKTTISHAAVVQAARAAVKTAILDHVHG